MITEMHLIANIALWIVLVMFKSSIQAVQIEVFKSDPHVGMSKSFWYGATLTMSVFHAILFDFKVEDWPRYFVILFFQVMWHMIIFGPLQNKLRKKGYFYLGLK